MTIFVAGLAFVLCTASALKEKQDWRVSAGIMAFGALLVWAVISV